MPYKDPEVRRIKQKGYSEKYYARYPNRVKAKKAAWHANQKAKELGVEGRLDRKDLEKLFEICTVCQICESDENLSIDHKVPWKKGGINDILNIQIICWQCNMEKTYKDRKDSWSVHGDKCDGCGTNERPHEAKGYCQRCYDRLGRGWKKEELTKPKKINRWW